MACVAGLWLGLGWWSGLAASTFPEVQIRADPAAGVILSWPGGDDFILEETLQLAPGTLWRPVVRPMTRQGDRWTVQLAFRNAARFYRLRQPAQEMGATNAAIAFGLSLPPGTQAIAGQPFTVEVRASFNHLLTAASYRLSASGDAALVLTGRNRAPQRANLLASVPHSLGSEEEAMWLNEGDSLEVLLGGGAWPLDGVLPGEQVLLQTLELKPLQAGDVTLSLRGAAAVTTWWARDGVHFDQVTINPDSAQLVLPVKAGEWSEVGPQWGALRTDPATEVLMKDPPPSSIGQTGVTSLSLTAFSPTPVIQPDANRQGTVDAADLVFVRHRLGGDPADPDIATADVRRDGRVDLLDLIAVRNRMPAPPQPRLNEIALDPGTGQAFWIELKEWAPTEMWTDTLELRNGAGQVLLPTGLFVPLWFGGLVQFVFDGEGEMEWVGGMSSPTGRRIHLPPSAVSFNPTNDECRLYFQGELVDSVRWGGGPELPTALNLIRSPTPAGGSIGVDSLEPGRWVRYATPSPAAENGPPAPTSHFPYPGGAVLSQSDTVFVWHDPRHAVLAYELEVDQRGDFVQPMGKAIARGTAHQLVGGLPPGHYYWRVRASVGSLRSGWSTVADFDVVDVSLPGGAIQPQSLHGATGANNIILWFAQNTVQRPHKDSMMICLECKSDSGQHAWNREHVTAAAKGTPSTSCAHDTAYTDIALAATVSAYYGEYLTQDEISFAVNGDPADGPEYDLGHGVYTSISIDDALSAALAPMPIIGKQSNFATAGPAAAWKDIQGLLDEQIPICALFEVRKSAIVTDFDVIGPVLIIGYSESYVNATRHLLVKDGYLSAGYGLVDWGKVISSSLWYPADPPGASAKVKEGDDRIFQDSDGDGVSDFDEQVRFGTSASKADTDGDGVEDDTEIWSYVFGKGTVPRTPDPDGDGLRAERDGDTDGDGCRDGEEDRNRDGTWYKTVMAQIPGLAASWQQTGETDPFADEPFKLTVEGPKRLAPKKTETVYFTLKNGADKSQAEAEIEVKLLTPELGGLGLFRVDHLTLTTDIGGRDKVEFTASTNEGTARIRATYKPCQQPKKAVVKEWEVDIRGSPRIFLVQTEARLSGPIQYRPYTVSFRVWPTAPDDPFIGYGSNEAFKDPRQQVLRGHFYSPSTNRPGLYLDAVSIPRVDGAVLRIDDIDVPERRWERTSEQSEPKKWEIVLNQAGEFTFPRVLFAEASGREFKTPLIGWRECSVSGDRYRERASLTQPEEDCLLLSFDHLTHAYEFFYGDGDQDGRDTVWTWQTSPHTGVSFIPITGLPGMAMASGAQLGAKWGNQWYREAGGSFGFWSNFQYDKNFAQFSPAAPWKIEGCPGNLQSYVRALGPMTLEPFVYQFVFQRDYLAPELKALDEEQVEPYVYEIMLRSE
jgi:hypothetical protein